VHNMKKLVDEVIKELEHTAQNRDIALKFVATSAQYPIRTDSLIAKEILTNLTSNAVKYTPDGGSVTVRISNRPGNLIVSVHDTGFGIPKSARSQIFTKFFRAPNVVKLETSGTGLGLYLVKGLAEQLGGKVWFTSEENKGSTFYFSLPKNPVTTTTGMPSQPVSKST
jgi:signal transduction histidine kinase